ncbi:unnamed protein product [Lactuca virosa]|uniref:GDSL esterase/lipase n=1 Tax=Lactuca virosa TaxID=75947 RepID=A0AAU9MBX9_9ASTR|nr:unnamed protein product [Lactuca virosa]
MSAFVQALILMVFSATLLCFVRSAPQVPCYFVFGDSSMDNGNNNHLVTTAKANYPPYGIDFPDGTTGRFSNGRNTADVVAQLLGFENSIPPFATARREEIVRGVNYASGAAGIRDETAEHMKLYKYGARKFGIPGAGYIGCTPAMMKRFNTNTCVDAVNGAIIQFNAKLVTALGDLESKLSGSKFIFIDPPRGYSSEDRRKSTRIIYYHQERDCWSGIEKGLNGNVFKYETRHLR